MSNIEWTDKTWNPVTGCTKISPGCANCYMYREYPRLKAMGNPGYPATPFEVTMLPDRLVTPAEYPKNSHIFVCSMSDLFHDGVTDEFIDDVFDVMTFYAIMRGHTYKVLTKRPGRALKWWRERADRMYARETPRRFPTLGAFTFWHPNIWMGTSVEEDRYLWRLDALAGLPATTRFISAEPLLGPLHISNWLVKNLIHWVIVGGESAPKKDARPMNIEWAKHIRDQCQIAGVPFFLKQLGGTPGKKQGGELAVLDGIRHTAMP